MNTVGFTHQFRLGTPLDVLYGELPEHVETVSEPRTTVSGTRILCLRDPEGNLVGVLETRDGSL